MEKGNLIAEKSVYPAKYYNKQLLEWRLYKSDKIEHESKL